MDFPAELGFGLLPAAPTAGIESSASDAPTVIDAGFAEYMRRPVGDALVEPRTTAGSAGIDKHGNGRTDVRELGDPATFEQPALTAELSPDASPERPIPELKPALSDDKSVPDRATPHPGITDVATAASAVDTAPSDDDAATLEAREEPSSDRPATGRAEETVPESEAASGPPILAHEQVVAAPAQAWLPGTREGTPADRPPHPAIADTTPVAPGDEIAPRARRAGQGSGLPAPEVASPHPELGLAVAESSPGANASTQLDGSVSSVPAKQASLPVAHGVGRTAPPKQAHIPAPDAEGDDGPASLEKPAGQHPAPESLVPGTEEGGSKQQPLSDSQIGRLLNPPGLPGSSGHPPHPSGGALTSGLVITRGLDAAPGTEAPAHLHEVALHITKTPDQDKTAIRIELDPADLGEVDIDLKFHDLRLTATVRAERPDVLDLLQRDVRILARALREAGVELADSDISFSHGGRSDHGGYGAAAQRAIALPGAFAVVAPPQDLAVAFKPVDGFVSLSDGRMDLRI